MKKGRKEGRQEGRKEGKKEGRKEGRKKIRQAFGPWRVRAFVPPSFLSILIDLDLKAPPRGLAQAKMLP